MTLHHDGSQAFYDPVHDSITIPPVEAFFSSDGVDGPGLYHSVLAHEICHSTGHQDGNDPLLNCTIHYDYQPSAIIDSGTWGEDLTWTLDENGLLTVSGTGGMADFQGFGSTDAWRAYRSSVTGIEVCEGVTSLGFLAFEYFPVLEHISLPNSLTKIGDFAVNGCRALTSVTVPANVTEIGYLAFSNNAALVEILVSEENQAFASVNGALFDKDVTTLISYPNGKEGVYVIPDGVLEIGSHAFYWSHKMTGVIIPSSVKTIGENAFQTCSKLADVVIPEGVSSIGAYTFSGDTSLHSITIPSGVTEIGENAFNNADLSDVYYGGSEAEWDRISIAENNQPLLDAVIHYAVDTRTLELPADLTAIESEAFAGLTNVDEIIIPDSVTSIAADAFEGSSVTLIVTSGSYAETWAIENEMTYRVR